MSNVYYSPEKYGLEIVGTVDVEVPDYSFSIIGVFYSPTTGSFYLGHTAGCSCPTPFEEFEQIEDLDEHKTAQAVVSALLYYGSTYEDSGDLIARIMTYRVPNPYDLDEI